MTDRKQGVSRRDVLRRAAGAAAGASFLGGLSGPALASEQEKAIKNGRINQSIVHWCFGSYGEKWSVEQSCKAALELGCKSVELVGPSAWPTLKKHGVDCAIAPNGMAGPPFARGYCNRAYHKEVTTTTKTMIDAAADAGIKRVIAFTGMRWLRAEDPKSGEIDHDEGMDNCVKGLKELVTYAEKKKVVVCLEHLNSRVSDDDHKGHPGYFGDHVDDCAEIIRRVGSDYLKLLFDIYHVQIMDGDLVTRLHACKDIMGHVHTAGNPGRMELDDTQEINYKACMQALVDIGYKGFVGQEFIPTRAPMQGLREAVTTCDV